MSLSSEQGHFICKKLDEMEIIDIVRKDPDEPRLFVKDHLKIEDIPDTKASTLQEEIEKFQATKKDFEQKIESFQAEKAERQRTLFAEIENKLKSGRGKSELDEGRYF